MSEIQQCTIAFAGICQAVKLIQEIARDGETDNDRVRQSLESIMITDPNNVQDVYGGDNSLSLGYEVLIQQLSDKQQKDTELMRYILGILMLERKLSKKNRALGQLSDRIQQVHRQLQHYGINESQILASLANIYSEVISPLGPKVMISGRPNFIQNNLNQNKIRALLLSTMRSAVLWRQLGGKRRHLIFRRQDMIKYAQQQITSYV